MDGELDALMGKLGKIQGKVGGGRNASTASAEAEARGGRGADRFLDLKEAMLASLTEVRGWSSSGAADPTANPKEQIALDSKIKRALRGLNEDWHDLDGLVQAELRKRKSKFDGDELGAREEAVLRLLREIDDVKASHRAGYDGSRGGGFAVDRGLVAKDDCELFARPGSANAPPRPEEREEITGDQRQRLQKLKERDRGFDDQIGAIGTGVDALSALADAQNEEVKKQNVMLEDLALRMDTVHEHISNVNSKMKSTLDEVGRSSDKLCVDVMCLLFLIGLIVIMYQLFVA